MRPRFGSEYRVPTMSFSRDDTFKQLFQMGIDADEQPPPPVASNSASAKISKPIPIAKNGLYDSHSYVNVRSVSRTPPDGLAPSGQLVCSDSSPNDSVLSRSVGSQAGYMNLDFVAAPAPPHAHSRLPQAPAEMLDPRLNYADVHSNADGTLAISPSLTHGRNAHSNSSPSPTAPGSKKSPDNSKLSTSTTSAKAKSSLPVQPRLANPNSYNSNTPLSVSPKRASPSNVALSRSPSRGAAPITAQREVEYADLDFSVHHVTASDFTPPGVSGAANASASGFRAPPPAHNDRTEYAEIDMVRTDALSRLAKEHPAQRESRFRDKQAAANANGEVAQANPANRRSLLADLTSAFRPRASESTA